MVERERKGWVALGGEPVVNLYLVIILCKRTSLAIASENRFSLVVG